METTRKQTRTDKRILTVLPVAVFCVAAVATLVMLLGPSAFLRIGSGARAASAASAATTHVALDIMPAKPNGPADNWPAYVAASSTTVPANTVVTVTIRNFDLGDAALAPNSPLAKVQGTVDGNATFDGQPYSALDPAKVAHTFTIPQLGLNVPIPGDAPNNATFLTVTFSFRTGNSGSFIFQCFAPCGTGDTGFGGPMDSMGFMKGTLTVRA